jgi:hypothetical protein
MARNVCSEARLLYRCRDLGSSKEKPEGITLQTAARTQCLGMLILLKRVAVLTLGVGNNPF